MDALDKLRIALNRLDHFGAPQDDAGVEVSSSNTCYELLDRSEGLGHDMNEAERLTLGDLREIAGVAPKSTGDAYLDMLAEWQTVSKRLEATKARELELRLQLFAGAFPSPKEGTNSHKLPDGRTLKGTYKINRYVDEAALQPVLAELRERGCANTDKLVRFKPELAKREWNSLSDDFKLVFSKAITANPGTPGFEIVPAKGS